MNVREYADCDGFELAASIRRGDLTAQEALTHAYRIIEAIDPAVHAFVSLEQEAARTRAAVPTPGPLSGVPLAMKDCVDFLAGAPRRFGSRLTMATRCEHTDEVVTRYLNAGLNPIGTTNVPEFSSSLSTESRLHGPCCNPWDTTRSVGGSSGGSAAAVAYGAVPIAYGNDSAGSIRVPASCCGVFGFRPSRGRVPMGPVFGDVWYGLFSHHVITRSVRDSAGVLDLSHGLDTGAPYGIPTPDRPYLEECAISPGSLRIAVMDAAMHGFRLDNACARALDETTGLLHDLGHQVMQAPPAFDLGEMHRHLATLLAVALAEEVPLLARESGREVGPDTVEACHRALIERGLRTTAVELSQALGYRHLLARQLGTVFADCDLLLAPTLAAPPLRLGTLNADSGDLDSYLAQLREWSPCAPVANFAGVPSMSVPLCWSREDLPIGMMFTGPYADEATLFRLAGQLERALPWQDRHPPLSAWGSMARAD